MPFRNIYREQMAQVEYQTPGSMCSIPPEYEEHDHLQKAYHEMGFNYPQMQQASASRLAKYSTAIEIFDDASYTRQGQLNHLTAHGSTATDSGLAVASVSYFCSLDLEGQQSSVSSMQTDSSAESSTSEPSIHTMDTSPDDDICPMITGVNRPCNPGRCGPDAPCVRFTRMQGNEYDKEVSFLENVSPNKSASPGRSVKGPSPSRPQMTRRNPSDTVLPNASTRADAKRRAKQAHSLVEKKYRENLNAKLCQLHATLKTTRYRPRKSRDHEDEDSEDCTNMSPNGAKFRKGEVLDDALDYVNQTEVEMRHMENEIQRLVGVVEMLEGRLKLNCVRPGGLMSMPTHLRPG